MDASIDYMSYKRILQERLLFRQAAGVSSTDFNYFDFPLYQNFKILFHFYNTVGFENSDTMGTGFLHPTWTLSSSPSWTNEQYSALNIDANEEDLNDIMGRTYGAHFPNAWVGQTKVEARAPELGWWRYNTAFSYLMQNDEIERAGYLRRFIELLSTINCQSPWYFQTIKGLDDAVKRQQVNNDFIFNKERGKITIECLPDAADYRIGTLLDLYRTIVWSWEHKREVVPANLRKFDMSIVVFQLPINTVHCPNPSEIKFSSILGMTPNLMELSNSGFATLDPKSSMPRASYKIYEFHNCEFDYSSSASGVDNLSNNEVKETTYNIGIFYDDMYEVRYNEFMPEFDEVFNEIYAPAANITEVLEKKIFDRLTVSEGATNIVVPYSEYKNISEERIPGSQYDILNQVSGALENALDGTGIGGILHKINNAETYINKYLLGNIFGYSTRNIENTVQSLLSGDLVSAVDAVKDNSNNYNGLVSTANHPLGKILPEPDDSKSSSKDRPRGKILSEYLDDDYEWNTDQYNGKKLTGHRITTDENLDNIYDDMNNQRTEQYNGRKINNAPLGDVFEDPAEYIYKDDIGNLFNTNEISE